MNVGSLFTGVGGFDLGLERAGMRVVFQCEIDPWCRGILAQHWSGVPCYHDVRDVGHQDASHQGERGWQDVQGLRSEPSGGQPGASRVAVLCGGFPCQDLSVAGRRRGLDGERSGLFFEFARCADELVRPGGWVIVENVPGLLSSQGGRDFAVVVRTLGDIGFHDLAWRVLDSRYFGVPQRRRRVFIVGRRAAGRGAREVLLEPESGGGDFAPSREARPRVAASLSRGSSGAGVSAPGRRQEDDENIVGAPMGASHGGGWRIGAGEAPANHIVAGVLTAPKSGGGGSYRLDDHDVDTNHLIATLKQSSGRGRVRTTADPDGVRAPSGLPRRVDDPEGFRMNLQGDTFATGCVTTPLRSGATGANQPFVMGSGNGNAFDPQPDGPRYAAMGNAVTVPVAEWIGRRIVAFEEGRLAA